MGKIEEYSPEELITLLNNFIERLHLLTPRERHLMTQALIIYDRTERMEGRDHDRH